MGEYIELTNESLRALRGSGLSGRTRVLLRAHGGRLLAGGVLSPGLLGGFAVPATVEGDFEATVTLEALLLALELGLQCGEAVRFEQGGGTLKRGGEAVGESGTFTALPVIGPDGIPVNPRAIAQVLAGVVWAQKGASTWGAEANVRLQSRDGVLTAWASDLFVLGHHSVPHAGGGDFTAMLPGGAARALARRAGGLPLHGTLHLGEQSVAHARAGHFTLCGDGWELHGERSDVSGEQFAHTAAWTDMANTPDTTFAVTGREGLLKLARGTVVLTRGADGLTATPEGGKAHPLACGPTFAPARVRIKGEQLAAALRAVTAKGDLVRLGVFAAGERQVLRVQAFAGGPVATVGDVPEKKAPATATQNAPAPEAAPPEPSRAA